MRNYRFIGTLIDATTGLIYIGNGQYYDPETGRFLTRGVNPNSANPYVPWIPIGILLGPLGMISANKARKKMKYAPAWIIVFLSLFMIACWALVAIAAGGMLLAGCTTGNPAQEADNPAAGTQTAEPATESTETPAPTSTPSPTPTKTPPQCGSYCAAWAGGAGYYNRDLAVKFAFDNKVRYQEERHITPHPGNDCTNFVSYALRDGGLLTNNDWEPERNAWVNVPALFNYLKDNAGFSESEVFTSIANIIHKRDVSTSEVFYLREHNSVTALE